MLHLNSGDDTVRKVANLMRAIMFLQNQKRASQAYRLLIAASRVVDFWYNHNGVLYFEIDRDAFTPRHRDQNDSSWGNRLSIVFSSDNMRFFGY